MQSIEEILPAIYDASADIARWSDVIAALGQRFRGPGIICVRTSAGRHLDLLAERGSDPAFLESYVERYGSVDTDLRAALAAPEDAVVHFGGDRAASSREFDVDWAHPQGLRHILHAIAWRSGDCIYNLSLARTHEEGAYSADEIDGIRRLLPHLRRALRVQRMLEASAVQGSAALQGLDMFDIGLAVVDARGRVLTANPAAEAILAAADGLRLWHGRLHAETQDASARLARAIADAAANCPDHREGDALVQLPRRRSERPLSALVSPYRGIAGTDTSAGGLALLLIRSPDRAQATSEARLAQAFGLTGAEARLLAALSEGTCLADYAEAAGISVTTAKYHLKNLFQKTGESRQVDLVRRIMSDPLLRAREPAGELRELRYSA